MRHDAKKRRGPFSALGAGHHELNRIKKDGRCEAAMKGPRRCSRSRKWDVATSECHRRLSEKCQARSDRRRRG